MWKLILPIIIFFGVILSAFIVLNNEQQIEVDLFWTTFSSSAGVILILAFFAGVVAMYVWSIISEIQLRTKLRRLEREKVSLLKQTSEKSPGEIETPIT